MTEDAKSTRQILQGVRKMIDALPDDWEEKHRERIEFEVDGGIYERTELRTPEGGTFLLGPARVWDAGLNRRKRNVDIKIDRTPEHLRDSGLRDCELTIYSESGIPLLTGPLKDDGNRQDGLGTICVAIQLEDDSNER